MTGQRRSNRHPGLTTLELMVVISIMAILFAMGAANYRGMQNRNAYLNEVERFGGELRNLGTLAQASGDLQPARSPVNSSRKSQSATSTYQWQSWVDGRLQQSATIGSRGTVQVQYSDNFRYRQALTKGACMVLCTVNQSGAITSRIMQVVFTPDGTPLDSGEITFTYDKRPLTLKISSVGGIEGPR